MCNTTKIYSIQVPVRRETPTIDAVEAKGELGQPKAEQKPNSNGSKSRSPPGVRIDLLRAAAFQSFSKSSPKVASSSCWPPGGDGNVAAHRVSKLTANEKIKEAAERSQAAERRRIASDKAAEEAAGAPAAG